MEVLVVTSIAPFAPGGADLLFTWLCKTLQAAGHSVDTLQLPFDSNPVKILDQLLAMRLLDVRGSAERMIAIRCPSHLLRHPNKIVWFIHHYRSAYDLWGTKYQGLPASPEGRSIRDAIRHADDLGLREAVRVFSNSHVVSGRLERFNGINSHVLYPPVWSPERFVTADYGEYFFCPARFTSHKRQLLAIEALAYTTTPVRLLLAGNVEPVDHSYLHKLEARIADLNLARRVTLMPQWIPEDKKLSLFAECLGTIYTPYDEDSYGFTTIESFHAQKPVITTHDSGGVLELVSNEQNGLVTDPAPESVGRAMDRLYADRPLARRLGRAGRESIWQMRIDWDNVLFNLLG
jgi:glycosyltransferase involved in cell wall biosynthesis